MKTKINKIILPILLISLVVPSIAFASWWNPFSWFQKGDQATLSEKVEAIKLPLQDKPINATVEPKKISLSNETLINKKDIVVVKENNVEDLKNIIVNSFNDLIQQYLPSEELEKIRAISNHTMASYDPDKTGIQLVYLPGSMVADDGTYFSATNLSSSNLNTDSATINSATIGNLSLDGSASFSSTNTGTLEVGSGSQSTGITIYDTATHEPFCVTSENGVLKSDTGKCIN